MFLCSTLKTLSKFSIVCTSFINISRELITKREIDFEESSTSREFNYIEFSITYNYIEFSIIRFLEMIVDLCSLLKKVNQTQSLENMEAQCQS